MYKKFDFVGENKFYNGGEFCLDEEVQVVFDLEGVFFCMVIL